MNNIKHLKIHIKGLTPLITHCDTTCNPLHPLTKKIKEITSIRKKTDDHHLALARLEFEGACYWDNSIGLHMPSRCLSGCFKSAARKYKLGKTTKAIIFDEPIGYSLEPYNDRNIDSLYDEVNKNEERINVFVQSICVNNSRIMRTRPIFNKWEVKFGIYLDTELMTLENFKMIIETAGNEFGLCELRPEKATGAFGKFELISIQ